MSATSMIDTAVARPAALKFTSLSRHIGCEVEGIDLRQPIEPQAAKAIYRAFLDHAVLLFRDQDLTQEDLIRVTGIFGEFAPLGRPRHTLPSGFSKILPNIMLISNIRENGKPIGALPDGEMFFHSDLCYTEHPVVGTMLYSLEVPREGGDTLFADMYAAYDALPAALKARIDGLRATNRYEIGYDVTIRRGRAPADAPAWTHPMVRVNPQTGRKALYVNRLMTHDIEGMAQDEAEALLDLLYDHQEQRQFIYEHRWRPGDVILWDNRCTLHARTDFSPGERRLLKRITIARDIDA